MGDNLFTSPKCVLTAIIPVKPRGDSFNFYFFKSGSEFWPVGCAGHGLLKKGPTKDAASEQ
jgi:hypothetical protein